MNRKKTPILILTMLLAALICLCAGCGGEEDITALPDYIYLADYVDTFTRTLEAKAHLAECFALPVPDDWRHNSAWAGLLIAVANLFAPGAPGGAFSRAKALKALCALPVFSAAVREYRPKRMNRNKALVALLLRNRLYLSLSLLYTIKNRNI